MYTKPTPLLAVVFTVASLPAAAFVTIDWVYVGDAINPADPVTGRGSVDHDYKIGKYEVTIGQYTEFLNAAAKSDPYGLYSASMATNLNIAGIGRSGTGTVGDPYFYTTIGSPNRPITYVSWFDAARFTNWFNNGQGAATTETGVYNLNGATSGIFTAQPGATVWLPTEAEWYKAAYYQAASQGGDVDNYWRYPTASNTLGNNTPGTGAANYYAGDYATTQSPSFSSSQNYLTDVGAYPNSDSYYGTFDQGGNVWEWNDAVSGSSRQVRGAAWLSGAPQLRSTNSLYLSPTAQNSYVGFRLVGIPEPSVGLLGLLGGMLALARRRRSAL